MMIPADHNIRRGCVWCFFLHFCHRGIVAESEIFAKRVPNDLSCLEYTALCGFLLGCEPTENHTFCWHLLNPLPLNTTSQVTDSILISGRFDTPILLCQSSFFPSSTRLSKKVRSSAAACRWKRRNPPCRAPGKCCKRPRLNLRRSAWRGDHWECLWVCDWRDTLKKGYHFSQAIYLSANLS